jgi:molecular chaperone DnaK
VSDPIVGIDLGTSNTVVAHAAASGAVQVLADGNGIKIHPSVVSFHPTGGVVVGAAAKQRKVIDPKNTIYSVKRLIGRTFDSPEVQTARQRMPYQLKQGANQLPLIVTRAGEFAVPEISAIVLDHAKHVATAALGTQVSRAVVTVPASFNDAQRTATATAGSIAGLTVVRVLNEPTAAALAYGHTRKLRETIAVYDFGGGTFDITILKLHDQIYEVLGTAGDSFLGGDDLDERLVDRMVEKFLGENRVDLRSNEVSMMRLRAVAEQVKIELSRRSRAMVRVDEIAYGPKGKPLDLQIEIRRDEFVRQVADIIDRTFPACEEALKLANLTIDHIDDVILVGGSTKIPYVRDQVAKFFAKAPRTDVNPEDAVALGAALQASVLERALGGAGARATGAVFSASEGTFDGPGSDTATFANDAPTATMPEQPVLQVGDELLEPTRETPPQLAGKRRTAAYPQVIPPREVRDERGPARGAHHDVFEERTPPPTPPPASAPVIGRMTRSITPPAGAKPPPTPRTAPMGAARPTSPSARPSRPSTVTIPAKPEPGPASTRRGVARPPDEDVGFPNIKTEKAIADVDFVNIPTETGIADVPIAPSSTAKGFAVAQPKPPPAPASAPTVTGGVPRPVPSAASSAPTLVATPQPPGAPVTASAPTLVAPPLPQTYPVVPSPVVMDVTPRGLGIGTVAGFCEELIRRNSRVPTATVKLFTTSRDDQDVVRIIVCQGESRKLANNTVIGDLRLEGLPRRPRGETSIEVTFALDASGILQVRARDAQTGREQRASLDIVGTIQQQDVESAREKLQALRR